MEQYSYSFSKWSVQINSDDTITIFKETVMSQDKSEDKIISFCYFILIFIYLLCWIYFSHLMELFVKFFSMNNNIQILQYYLNS